MTAIDALLLATRCAGAEEVFAGRDVLAAYAFGSRAGFPREDSDVDVGY